MHKKYCKKLEVHKIKYKSNSTEVENTSAIILAKVG